MRYQGYVLPNKEAERDRVLTAIRTHGRPDDDLVQYAITHGGLDVVILRNVVMEVTG